MQVFIVDFDKLHGRIDPYYYFRSLDADINKLQNLSDAVRIGELIKSWNRSDGPREGFYTDDKVNGVYFLRAQNLKNHGIDLKGLKYINRIIHEGKLKRTQVKPGDVIFAISGTKDNLGTVSIVPD